MPTRDEVAEALAVIFRGRFDDGSPPPPRLRDPAYQDRLLVLFKKLLDICGVQHT